MASHRLDEATRGASGGGGRRSAARGGAARRSAAQAGYTRTNHVDEFGVPACRTTGFRVIYPDVPDNYRTRLDVQWPLYTGGRLERSSARRGAERAASANDVEAAARRSAARDRSRLLASSPPPSRVRVLDESLARIERAPARRRGTSSTPASCRPTTC